MRKRTINIKETNKQTNDNTKLWQECGTTEIFILCYKKCYSHFKKSLAFLIKLNMHFINDKAVPFLDIYPNKLYAHTQKLVSQCL